MSYVVYDAGEKSIQATPYSRDQLEALITASADNNYNIMPVDRQKLMAVFDRVGNSLTNPSSEFGARVRLFLSQLGMSQEERDYFISVVVRYLTPKNLQKRWDSALTLSGHATNNLEIYPVGLVTHIGSTNTALGGLDALIDSVLIGNHNLFKLPAPDGGFPGLFLDALLAFDDERVVTSKIDAFWWPGGDSNIENVLKKYADLVIVWGSLDAVTNWKRNLGKQAQLLEHGPKYGIGIVTRDGIEQSDLKAVCHGIAWDISSWDQKACNCLQALYIDARIDSDRRAAFLLALQDALDEATQYAPPARNADMHVEVLKSRQLTLAGELINNDRNYICRPSSSWTLCDWKQWENGLPPSYLYRFLNIVPYDSLSSLAKNIQREKYFLQTMGICVAPQELQTIKNLFATRGVTRIVPFGKMTSPSGDDPHDGNYDLRLMCHIVSG